MLKDHFMFFREFLLEFQSTGTFFPSSQRAADALANPLLNGTKSNMNILEVGPGSGQVTVRILKFMRPSDRLTVCEMNPRFMNALQGKLNRNADFERHRERVSFYLGPVQNLETDTKFDLIVCAIPFLNLSVPLVKEIFDKFHSLSNNDAVMTYFEYIGIRPVSTFISPPARRQRMRELDSFFMEFFEHHKARCKRVWRNLPPINVYTLEIAA